jgi:hypothetical protein
MGDLKNAAIVCAGGDGGRIPGALPSEIDASKYHGFNYMVVVRLRADPVISGLMVTMTAAYGIVSRRI